MKKTIGVLFVLLFYPLICGFSLSSITDPLYQNIKQQALNSFSDIFSGKVEIESVSGPVVGKIVLNHVKIGEYINAQKIIIEFNPIEYVKAKGDVVPAISTIRVIGGKARIIRDSRGSLNAADFLKPPKPGGGVVPFSARVELVGCNAEYTDVAGLPYRKIDFPFKETFSKVNGMIDLRRATNAKIDIAAFSESGQVFVKGPFNLEKGSFNLKLLVKELDLNRWGNYAVPYLNIKQGKANLVLDLSEKNINVQLTGRYENFDFIVSGKVYDRLDLAVNINNADLKALKDLAPDARQIELVGSGSVSIAVSGSYDKIKAKISSFVRKAKIFGQEFSGRVGLDYYKGKLSFNEARLSAYGGALDLKGEIELKGSDPVIKLSAGMFGLDLKRASNNSPVVSGKLSGRVEIQGALSSLNGDLTAKFQNCSVLGQPIEKGEARFNYSDGQFVLSSFGLSSSSGAFSGSGSISSDLYVSLAASASGIRLKGSGVIGAMQAKVNNFNGSLGFRLDDKFMRSPLKNLVASGTTEVTQIILGPQTIDRASGGIYLDRGKMKLINSYLAKDTSILFISGEAGIGSGIDLRVYGNSIRLADLKILDLIAPDIIKDPQGWLNLDLSASGKIDRLDSINDLLGLSMNGRAEIVNASLSGMSINELLVEASYKDRKLNVEKAVFKTRGTEADLRYVTENGSFEARLKGSFDLNEFSPLTKKAGIISGSGKIDLRLGGSLALPQGTASISLKNGRYNAIKIESIDGGIESRGAKVLVSKPIVITVDKDDQFKITGNAILAEKLEDTQLKLALEIEKGDMAGFAGLIKDIYLEGSKYSRAVGSEKVTINVKDLRLYPPEFKDEHYSDRNRSYYLRYFEKISSEVEAYKKQYEIPALQKMGGSVTGKLLVAGTVKQPKLELSSTIRDGAYGKYQFDSLSLNVSYAGESVAIKSISLLKGRGRTDLWGNIKLDGGLALKAVSRSMPLDVLNIALDRKFDGSLDLKADIGGSLKAPEISALFTGSNAGLAGVRFDRFSGQVSYGSGVLALNGIKFVQGDKTSNLEGYLNSDGEGRISASVEGETAGLINLVTDQVEWRGGRSKGKVLIDLKPGKIGLKGDFSLYNADLHVKNLDADIYAVNLSIEADGKRIELINLSGSWYGKSSRYKQNVFAIAGYMDLMTNDLRFTLSDTHLNLDLADLYKGEADLFQLSVSGDPDDLKIKGRIDVSDGIVSLPKSGQAGPSDKAAAAVSPVSFDLLLNLMKNVYISAGDVATFDLSNIFMNLEMTGQEIMLFGKMSDPRLSGKVFFKRGTVNIFNREFSLLSQDQQKQYYPYDLERISENYAQFAGDGVMPYLKLSAMVKVEDNHVPSGEQPKEVTVVSGINGTMQAKEESKKLTVNFEAFEADRSKSPPEMIRAAYSDQDIKVLLLPDFIKSIVGIEKGKTVNTNLLVADYLNSRVQTLLFRNLERGIEKALGLESLRLDYNFGSDIRRALGVEDTKRGEKAGFGVGFVKGFFDKLYIDVRYSQDIEQQTGGQQSTYLNYQLTYKLSPIWAVAYYREPASIYDLNSGIYKTTLKAGYSF